MSVEAITWALKQQIDRSSAKFVLVAMANCANQDMACWPSIQYLCDATCQDRKTVMENIKRLMVAGFLDDLGERKGRTSQIVVYLLKNPEIGTVDGAKDAEIGTVKEYQNRNSSENGTVPKADGNSTVFPIKESRFSLERVPKTGHGTVRNHKEPSVNRQTREAAFVVPDWLPVSAWNEWDDYRKRKSKSGWTERAKQLSLRTLTSLRDAGNNPVAVIEQSIEGGWTRLFELKGPHKSAKVTGRDWWSGAGFENRWKAENAGCTEVNSHLWREGRPTRKIAGASIEPWEATA